MDRGESNDHPWVQTPLEAESSLKDVDFWLATPQPTRLDSVCYAKQGGRKTAPTFSLGAALLHREFGSSAISQGSMSPPRRFSAALSWVEYSGET